MRERGSALLTAVISVTVLMLISGVFFSLVNDQMKSNSYEEKAIKSYYLAQAGVFYGIAKIRASTVPTPNGTGYSTQLPVNEYGGQFNVEWQKSSDGLSYIITGKGSYGSGTGEVTRTLQVYYKMSSTGGGTPEEIVGQILLNPDEHHDTGQGQTMFVVSNSYPLEISGGNLPAVTLSRPIYIYTVQANNYNLIGGQSKATFVRLSLRDSLDQTIVNYSNIEVPDFKGVSGINLDSTGVPTPVSITYSGSGAVYLVVEGTITRGVGSSGEETGTKIFLGSPYAGIIWQVEQ